MNLRVAWEVAAPEEAGEWPPSRVQHRVVAEHTDFEGQIDLGVNRSNTMCYLVDIVKAFVTSLSLSFLNCKMG